METITFDCRFITPAFIGGGNPNGTPELRPPSIKGALRFWWRTMNGYLVGDNNSKPNYLNLLEAEEQIFGGANVKQLRSPVRIKIKTEVPLYIKGSDLFKQGRNEAGMSYLLYSVKHHRLDDVAFDAGTKFSVEFSSLGKDVDKLKKAVFSFWLVVYFGALGTRSRRGMGSISVEKVIGGDSIIPKNGIAFIPNEGVDMSDFLSSNFLKIKSEFSSKESMWNEYSQINLAEPAHLSEENFNNWPNALNSIGLNLMNIRTGKPNRDKRLRKFTMETLNKRPRLVYPCQ
ncbi:MAG: type III-B CRISPR module RAMP protein Cmr1 [Saprospiraceae bacterium]